jgi:hypothetical protein
MKQKTKKLISILIIAGLAWQNTAFTKHAKPNTNPRGWCGFMLRPRAAGERDGVGVEFALNVGYTGVAAVSQRLSETEFQITLLNRDPGNATDISFRPNEPRLANKNSLGEFHNGVVYELLEVSNSENTNVTPENPGDRILFTGVEINYLGLGPHLPVPAQGKRVYRFKKVSDQLPSPAENGSYDALLKDSHIRYKRYGLRDRFEKSFIANEIRSALEDGLVPFSKLFCRLSKIIEEDPYRMNTGDLSRVFGDIVAFSGPAVSREAFPTRRRPPTASPVTSAGETG